MSDRNYPSDPSALRRELRDVIRGAYDNDVVIEGSYELRFDENIPDYEAVLLEVAKPTAKPADD